MTRLLKCALIFMLLGSFNVTAQPLHHSDFSRLKEERIVAVKEYVKLLGEGSYPKIINLFNDDAKTISSSGLIDNPNHFYTVLFTETIKEPKSQLLSIYFSNDKASSVIVHFLFSWLNVNNQRVGAEFIDLIHFDSASTKIDKLMVFSNTFQSDIMKSFNEDK